MAILNVLDKTTKAPTPLTDPQTLQWDLVDLEAENSGGINQLGERFRDVIDRKVTLNATWGALTDGEISSLLDAIGEDTFILEYPDAAKGRRLQGEFYVSSRTAPMYCYTYNEPDTVGNNTDRWSWQGLTISFVQV